MSQPAEAVNSTQTPTASGLNWQLRSDDESLKLAMSQHYGLSPLLASILAGRNIALDDVPHILTPALKASLPDPSHLLDMDKAIARVVQAISAREAIGIFGDYDVDGATSSAQLILYLQALDVPYYVHIPDRAKEGYGPNIPAFDALIEQGATLIITLDCGTLAHDPIAHAKENGVDVIVIDHHISSAQLPNALAIVNPNRLDETSDQTNLCAAGVMFLVLIALNRALREVGFFTDEKTEPNLLSYLDLVALGTVCDVMKLTGLNRALVSQGLKIMAQRRRVGLNALADIAQMNARPDIYHLGFLLGPRINAGGRVGQADLGVRLLTTQDEALAEKISQTLNRHNLERQAIEQDVLIDALQQAQSQENMPVILVAGEGWHEGVIGIIAGRLKEKFSKPAMALSIDGEFAKGSARSVSGADMGTAMQLAQQESLIIKGGGHAMAAGFTLQRNKIAALHQFCCDYFAKAVGDYAQSRCQLVDIWLDVAGINKPMLDDMAKAAPYGIGFVAPKIVLKNAQITYHKWLKEKHLKLRLKSEIGVQLDAIAFNVDGSALAQMLTSNQQLHLYGEAKTNEWQGRITPQFIIRDAMLVG
jgi:single-stranded-DNA-specific exonuclease